MSAQTLETETLKGMGRFYSWKHIMKHLAKLDLYYAGIGIFGKTTVNKTLKQITACRDKVLSYNPDNAKTSAE